MAPSDQSSTEIPQNTNFFEVPAMNVQNFVGRESLLERMDGFFQDNEKRKDRTGIVVILLGMGGQSHLYLAN